MSSSKHQFACITMVTVHLDASSVRVLVTYEFLNRSCFYQTHTM